MSGCVLFCAVLLIASGAVLMYGHEEERSKIDIIGKTTQTFISAGIEVLNDILPPGEKCEGGPILCDPLEGRKFFLYSLEAVNAARIFIGILIILGVVKESKASLKASINLIIILTIVDLCFIGVFTGVKQVPLSDSGKLWVGADGLVAIVQLFFTTFMCCSLRSLKRQPCDGHRVLLTNLS